MSENPTESFDFDTVINDYVNAAMRQITYHNSLQPMQMFFNPQSSTFTRH
jgi:hypothetical protein